jgi:integrase
MESILDIDPLTEFFDAIKNSNTKRNYERDLSKFFSSESLKLPGPLKEQAREFSKKAKSDPIWATNQINEYIRYQKLRAEKGEISESNIGNYYKPIRLFCEENDILLNWKKISRRIPNGRHAADDRIPTLEEIKKLLAYPDRRVRIAVLIMLSSGCRIGALSDLNYGHIEVIEKAGEVLAAKVRFYPGTNAQYFSFITPETYQEIKEYIDFRKENGEKVTKDSPVFRDLFVPELGAKGEPHRPKALGYNPLRNQIYKAYVKTGLRKHLPEGKKRHEFSADHAFRKFFTTVCLKHTSSLNVQILRGDDTGLMESYNRPSEEYLLGEYLKCIPDLSIFQAQALPISQDVEELKRQLAEEREKRLELEIQQLAVMRYLERPTDKPLSYFVEQVRKEQKD